MEGIIILLMIIGALLILGLLCSLKDDVSNNIAFIYFGISELCIIVLGAIALYPYSNKEIPAMEVYRGNTTLQITYKDSVPIDSVVVYKNK